MTQRGRLKRAIRKAYRIQYTLLGMLLPLLLSGCGGSPEGATSMTPTETVSVGTNSAQLPTLTSPLQESTPLATLATAPKHTVVPSTPSIAPSATASIAETPSPAPTATFETIPNEFGLTVPPGVSVTLFAEGLSYPTTLAFGEEGALYVGINNDIYPNQPIGEIYRLLDTDGDGRADQRTLFAAGLDRPVGLVFREGELYVSQRGSVLAMRDSDGDGQADTIRTLIDGLPAYGLHHNNSLHFGPDGLLYLTLGSTTNNEPEADPLNAAILRAQPDGSGLELFASGMRNPFDLAFDSSGNLFATDNGCDPPACQDAPEELNHIIAGADYGFPRFVGEPPADSGTRGPIATFPPHTSANGLIVYEGEMFPEWQGDLFVALFGSYLEGFADVGHRVLRVRLTPTGNSFQGTVHPFVEGLDRPLDLTVAPDGSIFIADFEAGRVYRLHRPR